MCWVIPPASPAATSVVRIASSSEVLPWSTWPITVTTGGLRTRSASSSVKVGSSSSSSLAWMISTSWSNSPARTSTVSSVRVCVSVAISPCCISFLITSALLTPNVSETSRTVAPEFTFSASCVSVLTFSSGDSSKAGRRRRPRRRGGRCGGPCDMWSRRAACESITTRLRFLPVSPDWAAAAGRLTDADDFFAEPDAPAWPD